MLSNKTNRYINKSFITILLDAVLWSSPVHPVQTMVQVFVQRFASQLVIGNPAPFAIILQFPSIDLDMDL